jgi:hypothetical protein
MPWAMLNGTPNDCPWLQGATKHIPNNKTAATKMAAAVRILSN